MNKLIVWRGKLLAECSRKELVECVYWFSGELGAMTTDLHVALVKLQDASLAELQQAGRNRADHG